MLTWYCVFQISGNLDWGHSKNPCWSKHLHFLFGLHVGFKEHQRDAQTEFKKSWNFRYFFHETSSVFWPVLLPDADDTSPQVQRGEWAGLAPSQWGAPWQWFLWSGCWVPFLNGQGSGWFWGDSEVKLSFFWCFLLFWFLVIMTKKSTTLDVSFFGEETQHSGNNS